MRNRLSRCTLLCITVTVLGLLSTGCKTSSWSSWSWPGTSWLTGTKATSSEYQVPDKPSSNYSSLPVDQAEKYTDPQTTQGAADGGASYLHGNTEPLNNYQSTNQGNSHYLSPPPAATQQPVDPYVSPPINEAQQGLYNSNLDGGTRGSTLLPPTATPVTTGNYQAPTVDQTPPAASPLNTGDSNYNQGFYKPSEGQFGTQTTTQQDVDAFPINQGGALTKDPVYTGQLPATTGTQLDGLPSTAVPAGLPEIPPAGSYRPGSTGGSY